MYYKMILLKIGVIRMTEGTEDEKYWILGFLGFMGFMGFSAFSNHDPWSLFLFCNFGLFGFFCYKYKNKAIIYISVLGVAIGIVLGILGLSGLVTV